jgi:hypothetical protein
MINPVGTCRICKRRHDNIGFQLTRSRPIKWFCHDDSPYMSDAAAMTKKTFDIYETEAMQAGGASAGQYLDSINQTDLAQLDENQFLLFFAKFMGAYEDRMRKVFTEGK